MRFNLDYSHVKREQSTLWASTLAFIKAIAQG